MIWAGKERTHHDQTHHHHSHHRHHPRTRHRLHHRTADGATPRQRTTLPDHHIITVQILPRRQAPRPSRTRHLHRQDRDQMVPRRPAPIRCHRLVSQSKPQRRTRGAFLMPKTAKQNKTKNNKTKHEYTRRRQQTNNGGANADNKAAHPRHAYGILSWPFYTMRGYAAIVCMGVVCLRA